MTNKIDPLGKWIDSKGNLPRFQYLGELPFAVKLPNGKPAKLPTDPWFLLGNYRMTLFTHVSGKYQLITGQRAWGRLNQDKEPNTGEIQANTDDPFLFADRDELCKHDGFPPTLYMKSLSADVLISTKNTGFNDKLQFTYDRTINPGEEITLEIVIGFTFESKKEKIESSVKDLLNEIQNTTNRFVNQWHEVLPQFPDETDEVFAREMIWNAYNLEAMATYSEYFDETKIPQGTAYDYDWGIHASARDNYQHALPLPYYNPKLAKSVLRYMMKRTTPWGEIRLIEFGNGHCTAESYMTSDQQLYFFMLLAEYLRITKDYQFLNEACSFYPNKEMPKVKVANAIEVCFRFLRDVIGTGPHGLVRLLNSDWNDGIFYIVKEPYNRVLWDGESYMNSAMVSTIFENLIPQLFTGSKVLDKELQNKIQLILVSMKNYKKRIEEAFLKDLSDHKFSRRMYFAGKSYGDDNMFLEPQGFLLQINNLSNDYKNQLFKEMQKRVYDGEKIGARQQQEPEFDDPEFDKGSRENGGIWYALIGPVILGVASFDIEKAYDLLKKISFENFAKEFPQYWSSYWSMSDNFESSIIEGEGLPDQTSNFGDSPVYFAHAYAWPLYCYYRLKETINN